MHTIGRHISLLVRKSDAAKDRRRVLRLFSEWQADQQGLPPPKPIGKTLLLIRLDDIGDYILFRNQLGMYKKSACWKDHRITLLGNESWQNLFALLDADAVDGAIWVNKNRYLENAAYRFGIWRQLRDAGFETVITPSYMRPLLLDDLCVLAAAPPHRIGHANTNVHASWNRLSDSLYTSLFETSNTLMHEFQFNGAFTQWACGIRNTASRPLIERRFSPPVEGAYLVCFVGCSTRSRRWPARRWIEFIELYRRSCSIPARVYLAGNSKAELDLVRSIQQQTGAESIAGTVTLSELLRWVAGAQAVVTNDTMAAHMGVALDKPTVIVSNGINYMRFAEYRNAGIINGVTTIYPDVVNRRRERDGDGPYAYSETVTSDIASIRAIKVVEALKGLLQ